MCLDVVPAVGDECGKFVGSTIICLIIILQVIFHKDNTPKQRISMKLSLGTTFTLLSVFSCDIFSKRHTYIKKHICMQTNMTRAFFLFII